VTSSPRNCEAPITQFSPAKFTASFLSPTHFQHTLPEHIQP